MDVDYYRRALPVFNDATELPAEAREAFVRDACAGDAELEKLVWRLLSDDDESATFDPIGAIAASARPELLNTGDLVQSYQVGRRIGVGGTAEVWAVRHTTLGRLHALKVLARSSDATAQRLRREGQAQARLSHPNILPIHEILEVHGTPALLMPLVDGPSLATLLARHQLEVDDALALFVAVLDGVAHAHAEGFAHRDLKPQNVLLSVDSHQVVPLVVDFGLVKHADHRTVMTQTGALMGTPAYMAPEQHDDASRAGPPADVFALGVLLTEMLTGRRPFAGDSLEAIAASWKAAPDLRGVPAKLDPTLRAMLDPDPSCRPATAAALRERLLIGDEVRYRLAEGQPLYERAAALRLSDASLGDESVTAGRPAYSLPRRTDRFIGRAEALGELMSTLLDDAPPVLTVLGTGGAGKTRLCLEAAHGTLANWPGGAWWVDLAAARDLQAVISCTAAGLKVELGADALAQLGRVIANRGRCLVVLDNLEQVLDALPETLGRWTEQAPQAVFLCTSRAPLRLRVERRMYLSALSTDDAVALFEERARAVEPSFSLAPDVLDDVVRLTELLDGLPLAIELAACRSRVLPPAQLLGRIGRRFDLLRSGSSDVPERQRTLAATLAWSWDLLDPVEQSALVQVCSFDGTFAVEAATDVIRLPETDGRVPWVEDVLAELVDKSLVQMVRPGVMRLLVSVRAFAVDRLGEAVRRDAEYRHGVYFADVAAQGPSASLRREPANLVVATRRAIAAGDVDLAVRCVVPAAEALQSTAPPTTATTLLEDTLALPGLDARGRARVLECLVWPLARFRPISEVRTTAERALEWARAANDTSVLAKVLGAVAYVHGLQREEEKALVLIEEALALTDPRQDLQLHCDTMSKMGTVLCLRRIPRYNEAVRCFERAKKGNTRAKATHNLGVVLLRLGRQAEARAAFEEARAIARSEERPTLVAGATGHLGEQHLQDGRITEASAELGDALEQYLQLGDTPAVRSTLARLAEIALMAFDVDLSWRYLERLEGLAEFGWTDAPRVLPERLGRLARAQGQWDLAQGHFERALEYCLERGIHEAAAIQVELGWLAWFRGDAEQAATRFAEAASVEGASDYSIPHQIDQGLAWLALDHGEARRALDHLGDRETQTIPQVHAVVSSAIRVLALLASGKRDRAEATLGELVVAGELVEGPGQRVWIEGARAATGDADGWRALRSLEARHPKFVEMRCVCDWIRARYA